MTVSATHRSRLGVIRERTHTARSRRANARELLDAARAESDIDAQAVAQIAYDQADVELQTAERLESQLLSSISGMNGAGPFGESVFENPETLASLERLASSSMPIGRIDLGPMLSRDDMLAMIESGSWGSAIQAAADVDVDPGARVGIHQGIRPQLRRRLSVLDLIATAPMDSGSFAYSQESGGLDTAAEVVEGQVKPEADLTLDDEQVVAATIAHWSRLKRAQLADVPALATTVQTRLTSGVMRRLEKQLIAGNGIGANIKGILSHTGLGDIAYSAAGPLSDLTLDGLTATILADADPNGVVAHPSDVATMLKATAAGSGQRLDSAGAFSTPPTELWGLPLVLSTAITQGTCLVGDFRQATVFVREGVTLRISDSDQDAFVRNLCVFLAEGRFGLAVWAPAAFSLVHLEAA